MKCFPHLEILIKQMDFHGLMEGLMHCRVIITSRLLKLPMLMVQSFFMD